MTVKVRQLKNADLIDKVQEEILAIAKRGGRDGVNLDPFEKLGGHHPNFVKDIVYAMESKGTLPTKMIPKDIALPLDLEKRYFHPDFYKEENQ